MQQQLRSDLGLERTDDLHIGVPGLAAVHTRRRRPPLEQSEDMKKEAIAKDPHFGVAIDDFEILRLLGKGAYGKVYQGPILQSSVSAENLTDKFSPSYFGQSSTLKFWTNFHLKPTFKNLSE
jgi:hypothetical protein